ncbi:MAG TPA: ComEA family DNA-binding protein [Candidatus Limnocylindrales bacterium]|nr:ComEA family DNA-binding protein [Candidatus Limnocylindrales bacterium]
MDRLPDWRPVEAEAPDGRTAIKAGSETTDAVARWQLVAVIAVAVALLAGGALMALLIGPGASPGRSLALSLPANISPAPETIAPTQTGAEPALMVDVNGAVSAPGLYSLPASSRVGDAIAAAGGYSAAVDLEGAAAQLNLAARLDDGDKVYVPRRGEPRPLASSTAATGPSGQVNGLIDVNHADQRLLETLPGIGPVMAGKIIAARSEAAFTSVEDLLSRKVVGPATFEKIRQLVTVGN